MVLGTPIVELWRRGQIGKVPALEIDGALVCDSTDIAYELERRYPTPAILPATARERALCHALEEWADESIYFVGLYFQWCDPDGAPMVKQFFRTVPVIGGVAYPLYARVIRRQVREQGTGRKPRAHIAADSRAPPRRHRDDDRRAGVPPRGRAAPLRFRDVGPSPVSPADAARRSRAREARGDHALPRSRARAPKKARGVFGRIRSRNVTELQLTRSRPRANRRPERTRARL